MNLAVVRRTLTMCNTHSAYNGFYSTTCTTAGFIEVNWNEVCVRVLRV